MSVNETERSYKAFISYRHKPLDMEYAKKLHQRIERYVVPKEVRTNGEKKLGLVFRDQDELPIANNLSENIRTALDHSEFLIVICSPDTPESLWVQREITYFLSTHSRDKVLAMLVSGEPDKSFPPQLTQVTDEEGNGKELIEPLAANITAESAGKRNRLFKIESLRILASLIGCPFDALYQREQRYKMRRFAAASSLALLVAAGFIVMLADRNAKIREQLRNTQINESKTLAALSKIAFRDGDYRGALEYALQSLPGPGSDRPYVADGEYALGEELYLYQEGMSAMGYVQSVKLETEIMNICLSDDGLLLALVDKYGSMTLHNAVTGRLLMKKQMESWLGDLCFDADNHLLVRNGEHMFCVSPEGEILWESKEAWLLKASREKGLFLERTPADPGTRLTLREISSGRPVFDSVLMDESPDHFNEAAISADGAYAALMIGQSGLEKEDLYVISLESGKRQLVEADLPDSYNLHYRLCFTEDHDLVLGCGSANDEGEDDGSYVALYDGNDGWERRFLTALDFGTSTRGNKGLSVTMTYLDHLGCTSDGIVIAGRTRLIMTDQKTGEVCWQKDLPGYVMDAIEYYNDSLGLILDNGVITMCTTEGGLGYDIMTASFECGYELTEAASCGRSFGTGKFAVVSDNHRTQAVMICMLEDEAKEEFPYAELLPENTRIVLSPSGKLLGGISYSSETWSYVVSLIDPSGKKEPVLFRSEELSSLIGGQDHFFVCDNGLLLAGGKVIDPVNKTIKELTEDGFPDGTGNDLNDFSYKDSSGSVMTASISRHQKDKAYSLLFWKDGELYASSVLPVQPSESDELSSCAVEAYGECGYAVIKYRVSYDGPYLYSVYSVEEGKWKEAGFLAEEDSYVTAAAQSHPWLAVQEASGDLYLQDLKTGKKVCCFESSLPGAGVVKMIFAREDELLLVFTDGGDLRIFSTKDGSQLHRSSYSGENLRFYADSRYDIQSIPEEGRMIVICDNNWYRDPAAIVFDMSSLECTGFYTGFAGWLDEQKKVVMTSSSSPLSLFPFFTTEDIRERAEKILGRD